MSLSAFGYFFHSLIHFLSLLLIKKAFFAFSSFAPSVKIHFFPRRPRVFAREVFSASYHESYRSTPSLLQRALSCVSPINSYLFSVAFSPIKLTVVRIIIINMRTHTAQSPKRWGGARVAMGRIWRRFITANTGRKNCANNSFHFKVTCTEWQKNV